MALPYLFFFFFIIRIFTRFSSCVRSGLSVSSPGRQIIVDYDIFALAQTENGPGTDMCEWILVRESSRNSRRRRIRRRAFFFRSVIRVVSRHAAWPMLLLVRRRWRVHVRSNVISSSDVTGSGRRTRVRGEKTSRTVSTRQLCVSKTLVGIFENKKKTKRGRWNTTGRFFCRVPHSFYRSILGIFQKKKKKI